ncbi:hypothetical protein FH972_026152 [Carpinus fangiana]|uniref:Eukaryotic translation initiation factor 3 subunit A n=1 Tax=Carpinus fangiana TaxID=176857 RepID=A0A5N6L365_9ROSI|nr:hypothetical protein FH972_026152 [Carpinus fangiana]
MPPPPHTKPENVLKRAQELIGVNQQQAALSLLHEHVTSKRTRNNPIASIEPVMLLFVELCVDLRKGKSAKDGLYSYKNTAQNTNVGTIELVLKKFIELAEAKVTDAQSKADAVHAENETQTGTSVANVDDLEATETPESILLSTVSGEQSRDRTDRAIVTPWLKFLWETYRTVLDILKNNARLEVMYQSTAHLAFSFCQKFARKTEFRRLCELLRNHLQNAAKYQQQIHAINLSDPDTLQRHLDTRFQQLNVAAELELWQEAFRSVEDIHTLLNLSKRPAKNVMMANYFEKLSTIFLVSENYLFHAAAYSRYLNLLRLSVAAVAAGQSNKKDNPVVTDADLSKTASFVILSALSIPVISTQRSRGALVDADAARQNKNSRLTSLLGLSTAPSRASLLKEVNTKGLLKRARPEIRELYQILEVDFHPLSICKKISPILAQIGQDPEMGKYVQPLQQVILTRLFQQLSQVYESVELNYVLNLAQFPEPFQVSRSTIEKFIMNGCKKGDLAIRIDHSTGVLSFDSDVFSSAKALHPGSGAGSAGSEAGSVQRLQSTPAEIVRSQLTRLAKALFTTCQYVDPDFNEDQRKARAAALQRAEAGADQEHLAVLERREIIAKKKQSAASALAAKEKEEATRKRIRQQEAQRAEIDRLAEEQRERDARRIKAEQARVQREEVEKQLQELKQGMKGVDLSELDIDELDTGRIRAMKLAALEREKNELGTKLQQAGRKLDHLERAYRREEAKHLEEDYQQQRKRDVEEYDKMRKDTLEESEAKHKSDVALKKRLTRLVPVYEDFRKRVSSERQAEFEKRRKAAAKELEAKKQARVREFKERRAREKREAEEREQHEREEAERREREEAEEAARAEEKAQKLAEDKARREEERKKLDEVAERQRQRELEVEARLEAKRSGLQRGPPVARDAPSESTAPPKIAVKQGGGGWREREAAKRANPEAFAASEAAAAAAPAPAAAAAPAASRGGSGYLPPALRGTAGSGAGPKPDSEGRSFSRGDRPPMESRSDSRDEGRGDSWQRSAPRPRDESERAAPSFSRPAAPERTASGASGDAPAAGPTKGKWVPPHLRNKQ